MTDCRVHVEFVLPVCRKKSTVETTTGEALYSFTLTMATHKKKATNNIAIRLTVLVLDNKHHGGHTEDHQ